MQCEARAHLASFYSCMRCRYNLEAVSMLLAPPDEPQCARIVGTRAQFLAIALRDMAGRRNILSHVGVKADRDWWWDVVRQATMQPRQATALARTKRNLQRILTLA